MNEHLQSIHKAITEGNIADSADIVQKAIEANVEVGTILNQGLIPAMDEVGALFEKGMYFVPEMLISARAMQKGLAVLKPYLIDSGTPSRGKVAIGTVKGDLHDIGKNLVAMMLEGAGFDVLDLGTDAGPEKFVDAVQEGYQILAMSALLTTTMNAMEDVIQAVEEMGKRDQVKIIIGGAPVTQDFADQIGADGFAMDASSAVRIVKNVIN